MTCAPAKKVPSADAFGFGMGDDALARTIANMTTLWLAPWRAWCALGIEAMDVRNHGLPGVSPRA
jgi:hypothetical protein